MISKILIATDGSETAQKAARYAVTLAKQLGASLIIVSVVDNRSLVSYYSLPPETTTMPLAKPMENYLKKAAEKDVAKVKKLCEKQGVRCRGITLFGHPAEEIVKEAERRRVNLIILGSHGKRPLAAVFLGSVTYGVVHKDTKIPVLILRK
jgi:nucleotide-binding universal stress UspA family protein